MSAPGLFSRLLAALPAALACASALAQVCAIPGRDGPPATAAGTLNTYFAPSAAVGTVGPGTASIALAGKTGATTALAPGDLVLVVQMQCADLNSTDTSSYGDGVAGDPASGYTDPAGSCLAGRYQFVRAGPASSDASLDLTGSPLTATYVNAAPGTQGARRFQVIRVPQYSSLTLTGAVNAPFWNGSTGGVVVLDVAGTLNWNGQSIDVSGRGFRGGGGTSRPVSDGALVTPYVTNQAGNRHAPKGEGIAGTPRFVHSDTTPTDTGAGAVVDTGFEGLPNGSFSRGAPGTAGGGGAGINNSSRDNGGGGGGGNGGAGGRGAYGWRGAGWGGVDVNYTGIDDLRGFGGVSFPATVARLVMGGGGGAGDNNNNGAPAASSGGGGGGIVMVRAGTIAGTGTINADGARAPDQPGNDASGGGGAGGTVVVIAQGGSVGTLTVNVRGGQGGSSYTSGNVAHGGGGGGGGGVALLSGGASVNTGGGANGVTNTGDNPPGGAAHGATAGTNGTSGTVTAGGDSAGATAGARCLPQLTVTKTTVPTGPVTVPIGGRATYRITVSNLAGRGDATSVAISDVLPGSPSAFTNQTATPTFTLSGGATRPATTNAAVGATSPAWSSFAIPGGGSVQFDFVVRIPVETNAGTYQNPATATYADPVRTNAGGTTSAGYDPASSTNEDVTVTRPIGTPVGSGCPVGYAPGGSNLVTNPNFASGFASWTTGVTTAGTDTNPANNRLAAQNGAKVNYGSPAGQVQQSTFPGDPANPLAASAVNSWALWNGNSAAVDTLVSQSIAGLTAGRTYLFFAYVSNGINPGTTGLTNQPSARLDVTASTGSTAAVPIETTTTGDTWTRIQRTFTATGASATFSIVDAAPAGDGDDLAFTAVGVYECLGSGTISGRVYNDANADGNRASGEDWTGGPTVQVTLTQRTGSNCGATVSNQSVAAGAGTYAFANVTPGDYCVVLNTTAGGSATPAAPSGWTFVAPTTGVWFVSLTGANVPNQDFGLAQSTRIVTGRVFRDTGAGGGIANNGVQDGTEPGIVNVQVRLYACATPGTTLSSDLTDGAGDYRLSIPASVTNGTSLCVAETNPPTFVSTGAQVGTSGGTYSRATDTITFTYNGTPDSGLNFGDVPGSIFVNNNVEAGLPGSTVTFAHTFTAGTGGSVTFATAAIASPAIPGWSEVVYRDTNCNGQADAGELVLAPATGVTVVAGDQICIVVKEFIPAAAPLNAQNQVTVTATLTYTNASPSLAGTFTLVDLTTVGQPTSAGLSLLKEVRNVTQGGAFAASNLGRPGDTLEYRVTYTNNSTAALSTIVITDSVPAFTRFTTASCGANPPGITACAVTTQPAVNGTGALVWTFSGSLAPGGSSFVLFSVQVQP